MKYLLLFFKSFRMSFASVVCRSLPVLILLTGSVISIQARFIETGGADRENNAFLPPLNEVAQLPNAVFESTNVNSEKLLVLPDGKIIAAGNFRTVNGTVHRSIARLNADLTIDQSFQAAVGGNISAAAAHPDGKIIVAGTFFIVNSVRRMQIARLEADGSLDPSFDPAGTTDTAILDLAVQPDGKILTAGNFSRLSGRSNYCVSRLNPDGTPDTGFNSGLPLPIPQPGNPAPLQSIAFSIALQPDGKILLGGLFITGYIGTTPTTTGLVRLNPNGSPDGTFSANPVNGNVSKVVLQPDAKILIAGSFIIVGGFERKFVARLNPSGSPDLSFDPAGSSGSSLTSMALRTDGKILVAGGFTTFNNVARNRIALLNADGSLDPEFNPTGSVTGGGIRNLIVLSGQRVLAAASFVTFSNFNNQSLKLFDQNGNADPNFEFKPTIPGTVRASARQADGKVLIGGDFARIDSFGRLGFARFNSDGTLDPTFAEPNGFISTSTQVNALAVQPDQKILAAGRFLASGNTVGFDILRYMPDGSVDQSFASPSIPTLNGINAMVLQPDGKIVIAWGTFRNTQMSGGIARLNSDGTLDQTFPVVDLPLLFNSVALQPDGKVIVGGPWSYTLVNSQTGSVTYNGLLRFNIDGTHDRSYVPALFSDPQNSRISTIHALVMMPDGKLLTGGRIYKSLSEPESGLARLNQDGTRDQSFESGTFSSISTNHLIDDLELLPDGKILAGGVFDSFGGINKTNAVRLNSNGVLDPAFTADTDIYGSVREVSVFPNGKYLIGGNFDTVNGVSRISLAAIESALTLRRTAFDFDGDGRTDVSVFRPNAGAWYLNNSNTGFSAVNFGISTDTLTPADYDGDGKTDVAVFRDGSWYLLRTQAGFTAVSFGQTGDIPVPADFDGDGKAEVAVYRQGNWYSLNLVNNQFSAVSFGNSTDKPIAGDYDGDGKADQAVFRPSEGYWYLNTSSQGVKAVRFGIASDKILPADYDGDGKTDIAVFRDGNWYRLNSSNNQFVAVNFGIASDLAVPADYDGDGKADVAVFRNGNWYILQSTNGFTAQAFGVATDQPIPNVFVR